jgi:hypothetical protein
MTVQETMQKWDLFDQAITHHGFTGYNRHYHLGVSSIGWDRVDHPVDYLFRGCVEAHYQNLVVPATSYPDQATQRVWNRLDRLGSLFCAQKPA